MPRRVRHSNFNERNLVFSSVNNSISILISKNIIADTKICANCSSIMSLQNYEQIMSKHIYRCRN